jgi:hypothetical protein
MRKKINNPQEKMRDEKRRFLKRQEPKPVLCERIRKKEIKNKKESFDYNQKKIFMEEFE